MSSNSNAVKGQHEVVYEMFIPCVQRKYKMDETTKKPSQDENGEHIYDKERTEREIFWVMKQLDWGYICEVRVFGFDDKSKKNVTARISFSRINPKANDLIEHLDAGETAEVNHPRGFWHVVKYTRREPKAAPEPQVTFKIKVKSSGDKPRPHTPPTEHPEFKPIVKPSGTDVKPTTSSNKFKILDVEGASSSNASDSEESK
jgi:hypothetical protein